MFLMEPSRMWLIVVVSVVMTAFWSYVLLRWMDKRGLFSPYLRVTGVLLMLVTAVWIMDKPVELRTEPDGRVLVNYTFRNHHIDADIAAMKWGERDQLILTSMAGADFHISVTLPETRRQDAAEWLANHYGLRQEGAYRLAGARWTK